MQNIIKNIAACRLCGEIIESKHCHDFVRCLCGEIFVDGGREYIRRGAMDLNNIIDMSEYQTTGSDTGAKYDQ